MKTAPGESPGAVLPGSGDRIRTCDLWVMSPASYRAAPPRVGECQVTERVSRQPNRALSGRRRPESGSVRRRVQPIPLRDVVHPLRRPVRKPILVGEFAELGQFVQRLARRVVGVLDEQLAEFPE